MSDERHENAEKQEKQEEKRRQEHEKEEKNWEEKWRRDPLSAMVWAGILIWAGVVLLAENLRILDRFEMLNTWALISMGAGLIVLLEAGIRTLVPAYRRPVVGTIILGVILLAIGVGDLVSWDMVWPLVLIGIGVIILLRGLGLRR